MHPRAREKSTLDPTTKFEKTSAIASVPTFTYCDLGPRLLWPPNYYVWGSDCDWAVIKLASEMHTACSSRIRISATCLLLASSLSVSSFLILLHLGKYKWVPSPFVMMRPLISCIRQETLLIFFSAQQVKYSPTCARSSFINERTRSNWNSSKIGESL